MSNKEFEIIQLLSSNAGQVFDREKIYENIYIKLQQGYTLSAAMEAQGVAFPVTFLSITEESNSIFFKV